MKKEVDSELTSIETSDSEDENFRLTAHYGDTHYSEPATNNSALESDELNADRTEDMSGVSDKTDSKSKKRRGF